MRKAVSAWLAFLIAVVGASIAVWGFDLDTQTIGQKFGEIPRHLPQPQWPAFETLTIEHLSALMPNAFTIAFLAGVESLLPAVVADGMTGRRHRSNIELLAQGIANIDSVIMGGIPTTEAAAMHKFIAQCRTMKTHLILCQVRPQPKQTIMSMCENMNDQDVEFMSTFAKSHARAQAIVQDFAKQQKIARV